MHTRYKIGTYFAFIYAIVSVISSILVVNGNTITGIVLTAISAILYCVFEIIDRNKGVVHLDITFILFFTIYSLNVPFFSHLNPSGLSLRIVDKATLVCLLCHFGLAIAMATFNFNKYFQSNRFEKTRPYRLWNGTIFASYALLIVGVLSAILAIGLTVGFNAYFEAGYAGRSLIKRDAGPIEIGLYITATGLVSLLICSSMTKNKLLPSKKILSIMMLIMVVYIAFLGIRRPIFLIVVGLLAAYSFIYHRPKMSFGVLLAVPLFFALSTFAQYRQVLSDHGLQATVEYVSDNASIEWLDVSQSELGAPFKTLYDEIPNIERGGYIYGKSYLVTPLYILPSAINGGTQSLSMTYTTRYFDPSYISIGGNMGYFPATEAYYNFGYLGCILIFFTIGFILYKTNVIIFTKYSTNPLAILFFAILCPWLAFYIRTDLASVAKSFIYSQFVAILFVQIVAKLYHGRGLDPVATSVAANKRI